MAIATGFLSLKTFASAQIVPGSLDVRWQQGAQDCKVTTEKSVQVHVYNPKTYILRQSLCTSFEGNFIYLLIGSDRALLIDTGAVADPQKMPLAKQVLELLSEKENGKLPLLVVHTHSHTDHRDGDPQFQSLPLVEVVPWEAGAMRTHFGFANWPTGIAHIELAADRGCNPNAWASSISSRLLRSPNGSVILRRFSPRWSIADRRRHGLQEKRVTPRRFLQDASAD
jgi:hypothetical protein